VYRENLIFLFLQQMLRNNKNYKESRPVEVCRTFVFGCKVTKALIGEKE
jgi:hypothetical protein